MGEKTFTITQIKTAYFEAFNEAGEIFFDYFGTPEQNMESTESYWSDFLKALERISEC